MEQTRQSTDTPADADFLTGHLLIAMPAMADPRFAHSVIYVCAHTLEGAMGLVLNRPLERPKFDDLLRQLEVAPGDHDGRSLDAVPRPHRAADGRDQRAEERDVGPSGRPDSGRHARGGEPLGGGDAHTSTPCNRSPAVSSIKQPKT